MHPRLILYKTRVFEAKNSLFRCFSVFFGSFWAPPGRTPKTAKKIQSPKLGVLASFRALFGLPAKLKAGLFRVKKEVILGRFLAKNGLAFIALRDALL